MLLIAIASLVISTETSNYKPKSVIYNEFVEY